VDAALGSICASLEAGGSEQDAGWEDLVRCAFQAAQQALEELSQEGGLPLRDFAATLTCAVASADRLVVGQLGDGAVIVETGDGRLFSAARTQRGEYANETYFLTQERALEQVEIQVIQEPACKLALMSDGLTRLALKMPSGEPHPPFFRPLFDFVFSSVEETAAAEQLASFLDSERVCARSDDDKSLLLAVR
jgi:serine/threonine protein phosphatase PrpC